MRKIIISAMAQNRVIGKDDDLPWHSKEEFQHFKNTTLGHPMIMGRTTYEILGKPLKGREHLVISRDESLKYNYEEVKTFSSFEDAFNYCIENKYEKVFIIGGGNVYKQAVLFVDEIILSIMHFESEGDTYFPEINENDWKEDSREVRSEFDIVRYVRK